jgi:hypothetical protein
MDKRDVSALLCRETPDDAKGTVHRLDQRIDTVIVTPIVGGASPVTSPRLRN